MFMLTNTHTLSFSFKNHLRKRRPVRTLLSLRAQMCRDNTEVRQFGILLYLVDIPIMPLLGDFITLPPSALRIHTRACTPLHTHTHTSGFHLGKGLNLCFPFLSNTPTPLTLLYTSQQFFPPPTGVFGQCKYVYYGKHSEGNRFIRNHQL